MWGVLCQGLAYEGGGVDVGMVTVDAHLLTSPHVHSSHHHTLQRQPVGNVELQQQADSIRGEVGMVIG